MTEVSHDVHLLLEQQKLSAKFPVFSLHLGNFHCPGFRLELLFPVSQVPSADAQFLGDSLWRLATAQPVFDR